MKKAGLLFIILSLSISTSMFCENFPLDGHYRFTVYSGLSRIDISNGNLVYVFHDTKKENYSVPYEFIHIDGMPFIKLSEKFPKELTEFYIYKNQTNIVTDDKILILAGKSEEDKYPILLATTTGFYKRYPCTETVISEQVRNYKDCSSYLIEKNKDYPVKNLNILAADFPWVEGVPGDGIGEGFTIENSWGEIYPYLLIMNGYISYEKPYLYKQNGRVKKIKIRGLKSGKSEILDVLDTPHLQTVDISFITEPEDIRIEIEDVYKGTKYDDTCIHYMITYFEKVVPYENSIGD